jgi:hypothetical protein
MNAQSTLLLITGAFLFTATCWGQRPADKLPFRHFSADVIKVDSILSASSHSDKQRTSHMLLQNLKCSKNCIRFELKRNEAIGKENLLAR